MSRFDCVCVGVSTVDVLALLDRPLREDEKIAARTIVVDGGGPAGTAACAAASCGLKTAILSFIGRDLWADLVLDGCRRFGVSTRFLQIVRHHLRTHFLHCDFRDPSKLFPGLCGVA